MKTEIFKDYQTFDERVDKKINGVTEAFADTNPQPATTPVVPIVEIIIGAYWNRSKKRVHLKCQAGTTPATQLIAEVDV